MNSLKRRRIWEEMKEPDEKGCRLTVRIEETRTVGSSKPPTKSCKIKIIPPVEDEFGWPSLEPRDIEIDSQAVSSLGNAIQAIEQADHPRPSLSNITVELRYQVTKGLILIYETLPSKSPAAIKSRFTIEDGRNRFIIGSYDQLDKLYCHLKETISGPNAE